MGFILQTFEVIFIFSSRPIDDQWMILFSPKIGATWFFSKTYVAMKR